MPRRRGRLAALHEAGHFVAAHVQGHAAKVDSVALAWDGGRLTGGGFCSWNITFDMGAVSRHEAVVRALAGGEAERRVSRSSLGALWLGYASDDYEAAVAMVRGVHKGWEDIDPTKLRELVSQEIEEGRVAARELVVRHWTAVEALSDALLERRTLSGERAVEIASACGVSMAVTVTGSRSAEVAWSSDPVQKS